MKYFAIIASVLVAFCSADFHRVQSAYKDGVKWELSTSGDLSYPLHGRLAEHARAAPTIFQKEPPLQYVQEPIVPIVYSIPPQGPPAYTQYPIAPTLYKKQTPPLAETKQVGSIYRAEKTGFGPVYPKPHGFIPQEKLVYGPPVLSHYVYQQ